MATRQKVELKDVENPGAKDDWKPLVVGDMLHHLRGKGGQVSENKGIGDAGSTADIRILWSAMVCYCLPWSDIVCLGLL